MFISKFLCFNNFSCNNKFLRKLVAWEYALNFKKIKCVLPVNFPLCNLIFVMGTGKITMRSIVWRSWCRYFLEVPILVFHELIGVNGAHNYRLIEKEETLNERNPKWSASCMAMLRRPLWDCILLYICTSYSSITRIPVRADR